MNPVRPGHRGRALRRFWQKWRWWVAIILLTATAFGTWWFTRPQPPRPPLVNTTGFDPLIAAAIDQAREAVLKSPRLAALRGRMGMVLLVHEVRAEARECFTQAAAMSRREPHWVYYLGLAQLVDNPLSAVTNLDRAVRLFAEKEIAPRLRLADTLVSLGRLKEAEAHYRMVWQRETNSPRAALGLGKIANARDHTSEAEQFLRIAASDPTSRKAAIRLLLTLNQRLGRTNQMEQLTRTLASLPNDEPLPDPYMDALEELKTGEEAWINRGEGLINAGRLPEAARLLEKTIETYPKSERAMFFLGRTRLRLGDVAGAETILSQAVSVAPGSVEAQMQLGVVWLSQGKAKDAQRCFRAAIQAKPNLAPAWFNLGLSLTGESDRAECIAAFREAIRLKPDFADPYLALAVALRAGGQKEAAARELRRALDLQPAEPLRERLLDQLKLAEQP